MDSRVLDKYCTISTREGDEYIVPTSIALDIHLAGVRAEAQRQWNFGQRLVKKLLGR